MHSSFSYLALFDVVLLLSVIRMFILDLMPQEASSHQSERSELFSVIAKTGSPRCHYSQTFEGDYRDPVFIA